MATLIHEIWLCPDDQGQWLPACLLAGPDGDAARRLLEPGSRLIHTFEAASHFEAMTAYYRFMDFGTYTTDQAWDYQPYPEDRAQRQRGESV